MAHAFEPYRQNLLVFSQGGCPFMWQGIKLNSTRAAQALNAAFTNASVVGSMLQMPFKGLY